MITLPNCLIPPYLIWQTMNPKEKIHAEKFIFTGISSVAMQYPNPQSCDLYDFIRSKEISLYCAAFGMAIGISTFAKLALFHQENLIHSLYIANIRGFYTGATLGALNSIFNPPSPQKLPRLVSDSQIRRMMNEFLNDLN